jgi:hypothetical protein
MGKEVAILIGQEECVAELLEREAPTICRTIEEALPLQGVLGHGKLVDNEVYFEVPFFVDTPENLKPSQKGELVFANIGPTICIFYGDMVPFFPLSTFGRITRNFEGFQREAAEVWEKPGKLIIIKAKGV